jgi:hypothetical protein
LVDELLAEIMRSIDPQIGQAGHFVAKQNLISSLSAPSRRRKHAGCPLTHAS